MNDLIMKDISYIPAEVGYVLHISHMCQGWSEAWFFYERPSGKEIADAAEKIWFQHWGNLGKVITDSGGEFESEAFYHL